MTSGLFSVSQRLTPCPVQGSDPPTLNRSQGCCFAGRSGASPTGCGPKLRLADSHPVTDAWTGLGAKSLMQSALLRDHSDNNCQILNSLYNVGSNVRNGSVRQYVSRRGRAVRPGTSELEEGSRPMMSLGLHRAQL